LEKKKQKIDFKYNFKIYWNILRNYKGYILGILVTALLLESFAVLTRYFFKLIVDEGTLFVANEISKESLEAAIREIVIWYAITVVAVGIVRWIWNHWITMLEINIMLDIKKKFLNHLVGLSYNFHTTHKTGSLISKLVKSGSAVERMTDVFVFNFLPIIFQLVLVSATIIYFDKLVVAIIIIIFVIFLLTSILTNRLQEPAQLNSNDAEDYEKAQISDIFTNIESIKLFGKENSIKELYSSVGEKTKEAVFHNWKFYRWQSAINALTLGFGTLLLIYMPILNVMQGEMTIGTMVFIYTVYVGVIGSLFALDHGIRGFYRSMADFESLFKYGKIENEIKDKAGAKNIVVQNGEVEFKNIHFSYKNRPIFTNFNLKIPRNKKVAIIGPSGAGKTSLIRLIYRLYDTQEGSILIDGTDVRDVKQESLRSELSIVPQECILFDDTIYNNIAFSRPGASRKEVLAAMKFAQLDKIVANFPKQEKTIVGERGVKLSGGEKQRVSIARAILADRKILILDEATSSLDSETEAEIQKDLYNLMKDRTSIIIAHRLSTIMKADKIVVLDGGRIVQTGNHKELIRKPGMYKKLWNLQKGGYIE
jgi:ATP-binding cassette, subfamily B, heavy metal transporter